MKALAALFLVILASIVSILILMYGWGLEVKSWCWVIGGMFAAVALHIIAAGLNKD